MFRKTALIAALALAALGGGASLARADGDSTMGNIGETLKPLSEFGPNSMAGGGLPRLEVIAGMDRPVVVYDGPVRQNFAAPGGRLRVVPNDNGSYTTERLGS